ncbi:MAG: hypothetical protein JW782_00035 [Candidatus Saganbacteria bacterium]|nr:hypothetical protein [Candidatus Saganbacteria bacterium]
MDKKRAQLIWAALVLLVIICFGIFMVITVPEANTVEEVQELEEVQ